MPAPKDLKVTQMLAHPSLPLVALVYADINTVKVYRLEECGSSHVSQPTVHEPSFSLHGSYMAEARVGSKPIIDAKWVSDLDQLLILTADANGTASVDLIASQPSIKIISMLGNKAAL